MKQVTCLICYGQGEFSELTCMCKICSECLLDWIKQINEDTLHLKEIFLTCPNSECKKKISEEFLFQSFRGKEKLSQIEEIFSRKLFNSSEEYLKCPKSGCGFLGFEENDNKICQNAYTCEKCKCEWRTIRNNLNFILSNIGLKDKLKIFWESFLEELSELRIRMLTKPCTSCNRNIYKFAGCKHITCICKKEFCYTCSGDWLNHNNEECVRKESIFLLTFYFLFLNIAFKLIFSFNWLYLIFYYLCYYIILQFIGLFVLVITAFFSYSELMIVAESGPTISNIERIYFIPKFIKSHIKAFSLGFFIIYIYLVYKLYFCFELVNLSYKLIFYEAIVCIICTALYCSWKLLLYLKKTYLLKLII